MLRPVPVEMGQRPGVVLELTGHLDPDVAPVTGQCRVRAHRVAGTRGVELVDQPGLGGEAGLERSIGGRAQQVHFVVPRVLGQPTRISAERDRVAAAVDDRLEHIIHVAPAIGEVSDRLPGSRLADRIHHRVDVPTEHLIAEAGEGFGRVPIRRREKLSPLLGHCLDASMGSFVA